MSTAPLSSELVGCLTSGFMRKASSERNCCRRWSNWSPFSVPLWFTWLIYFPDGGPITVQPNEVRCATGSQSLSRFSVSKLHGTPDCRCQLASNEGHATHAVVQDRRIAELEATRLRKFGSWRLLTANAKWLPQRAVGGGLAEVGLKGWSLILFLSRLSVSVQCFGLLCMWCPIPCE